MTVNAMRELTICLIVCWRVMPVSRSQDVSDVGRFLRGEPLQNLPTMMSAASGGGGRSLFDIG